MYVNLSDYMLEPQNISTTHAVVFLKTCEDTLETGVK